MVNVLYILLALLIFGILIFIHELGHFIVARLFGVKILEFSIGMGPKIISHKSKKSGTAYSLRLFPIGGYVSMYGEDGMELVQGKAEPKEADSKAGETDTFLVNDLAEQESKEPAEPDPELAKQAYCNKSVWKRILISLAGPFMNVFLGFVLMLIVVISAGSDAVATTKIAGFFVTYSGTEEYAGLQNGDYLYTVDEGDAHDRVLSFDQLREAAISNDGTLDLTVLRLNEDGTKVVDVSLKNVVLTEEILRTRFTPSVSAATDEHDGLRIGDTVLKVNGTAVHTDRELTYEIMNQGYKPMQITVRRGDEKIVLENVIVPTHVEQGTAFGDPDFFVYREPSFNIGTILRHTWFRSLSTVKMVGDSFFGLFSGRYGFEAVSGPVGITKTISDVAKTGNSLNVLNLVIVISINLGIVNLFPFPALDGGHILLYIIEAIRRKPIRREVEGIINFIGLAIVLILAVIIAIKDVITL